MSINREKSMSKTKTKESFRETTSFEERVRLSKKIISAHPNRIPIVVEIGKGSKLEITRVKFLVPKESTIGTALNEIRKHISKLAPEQALFLLVGNNVMPSVSANIENVYEQHKDRDGFLTVTITEEATFGMSC